MRRTLLAAVTALALVTTGCTSDTGATVDALDVNRSDSTTPGDGANLTDAVDSTEPESGASGTVAPTGAAPGESTSPSGTTAPGSTPTPAPAATNSASSSGQSAALPIPAGTYRYATEGTSQVGENPEQQLPETTKLIVSRANADDEQRQVRDRRDEDGYGSRNTVVLRYGVAGATLLSSTIESTVDIFGAPFTSKTELVADPPVVVGPLDAKVGFKATIRLVSDDVTIDGTLEITGREAITIGGTPVEAFVVKVHYDLSGAIEGTSDATWWVRPDDLLNLREESRTEASSRGLDFREQYEAQLLALTPG